MCRDEPLTFLSGRHKYSVLVLTIALILNAFFSTNISISKSGDNYTVCNVFFAQPLFEDIKINSNTYIQIKMKDCVSFAASSGAPNLPVYTAKILVPNGKKVTDVSVSNSPFVLIKNDLLEKPILPQQEAFPFSVDADEKFFVINESIYNSAKPVFENVFSIGDIGFCRGYEILTVFLYPIQYIPSEGLLYYTNKMTVTVNFKEDVSFFKEKNNYFRGSRNDEQVVASIVENPGDVVTYSSSSIISKDDQTFGYSGGICDSSETYEYVIITSNSLKDATGYNYNLSDLISHRKNYSGLSGIIVSVEEINNCSAYYNQTAIFNDTQAHIREFCKDAYQDWNTEYVLLAGDWDSDSSHQIVPYRLFTDRLEAEEYNDMACDLYYSHLDGNWYHSDSGYWGGGLNSGVNDLYSELFVGRITASTAEMVSNAVSKIINYDTNDSLSNSWLRTVSFWGGDLGWTATSKDYMEEIRLGTDTYRTFTGFQEFNVAYPEYVFDTSERLYHKDLGSGYKTYFENSVESNNPSIVNHLDHSSWTNPLSLSTWDSISSTKPFFGFSQGCLAGRYQSGEAGCEKLICKYSDKHAYALVLNVGYGYGSASTTDGASQYIMAYFWDYFLNNQSDNQDNWQLGKAMAYAQDKIAAVISSHSHAWCYAWYSMHLFGDPAQTLRLNNTYSNDPVSQSNPNPINGSTDVSVDITNLSIILADSDGDVFNWSIQTSPDIGSSSGFNNSDGVKSCVVSGLSYSSLYTWFVNTYDGDVWCNNTYVFTTESDPVNYAPEISNPSIANGSTGFTLDISNLSVFINEPEGESFNWSIQTSPNIGSNSGFNDSNGSKICNVTNLFYGTTYTWFVNTSDGNSWNNSTYYFTVRTLYTPDIPTNFTAVGFGRFEINLTWINDNKADFTRVEWSNFFDETWSIGDHNLLYSGSLESFSHTGLIPGLTCFYKAWSYNITDNTWGLSASSNAITSFNSAPSIASVNPVNGSVDQDLAFNWSVTIYDSDGDSFNFTIECSNGESNSLNNVNNATFQLALTGLQYNTFYAVWVNVTDNFNYSKTWYVFTTEHMPGENFAPVVSSPSPSNNSNGVSISRSSFQVMINDPNGDVFNWSIQASPDVGSNSGVNASNGSVSCSISGLGYSTTYIWFVSVSDGYLWCNQSFVFTTSSRPNPPSSGGGGGYVVVNAVPVADAGGPYSGFTNESVSFNGLKSVDSDGSITSYSWTFGDGTTGLGVSVSHVYSFAGNYSVTLTVTDDDGSTDSDTTIVSIRENIKSSNLTTNVSQEISGKENDSDSTFVSDDVVAGEIKELFDIYDDTKIQKVNDLVVLFYLIDSDGDGSFDVLYDYEKGFSTNAKFVGENVYLLDVDNDGVWDYKYNTLYNILSAYNPVLEQINSEEFVIYFGLVFVIFLAAVFVLLILIIKRRSSLSAINVHPSFARKQAHFFSRDKYIHTDVRKLNEKYEHIQSIYSKSNKSDIIYNNSLNSDIASNLNKPVNIAPKAYDVSEIDTFLDEIRSHVNDIIQARSSKINKFNEIDNLVDDLISSKVKE